MPKLKLDVDALRVDSFEARLDLRGDAAAEDRGAGEMAARYGTYIINCFYTQQASCTC
jgi:hypothetical protein